MALGEAAAVEVLLHRVARGEQADAVDAGCLDALGGGVGDVQQRDVDGGLDIVGEPVHRVRAEHEALGARLLQAMGESGEPATGLVPVAAALELFDRREVHAPHDAFGGVQAAQSPAHGLVEQAVVLDRGLPAHATEQPDRSHRAIIARNPTVPPTGGRRQLPGEPRNQLKVSSAPAAKGNRLLVVPSEHLVGTARDARVRERAGAERRKGSLCATAPRFMCWAPGARTRRTPRPRSAWHVRSRSRCGRSWPRAAR